MANISYTIDEYVIKYDHIDFSGENIDKFDSLEEAVDRLKQLELKGCFNFKLYHMTKEVFDVSKIWDVEKLELRKKEPEFKPEFKPFDKVLVRDLGDDVWKLAQYAFEDKGTEYYKYNTVGGNCWKYCIPYEGNEHLLGTTENCE